MKLKAIALALPLLAASACYYIPGDGKNSRVSLLLSRVPADVAKIHVAVCQGSVSEENVLSVQTFEPTSAIVVQASPGPDRIVEVIGVNRQGYAAYCGTSLPMTFEEGSETVQVSVTGITIGSIFAQNPPLDYSKINLTWISNWNEGYVIYRYIGSLSSPADNQYSYLVETPFKSFVDYFGDIPMTNVIYHVRGYSPIFDVYTVWFISNVYNRT
jgi:hypothetical protein